MIILRTVGQQLHPVGTLELVNVCNNPSFEYDDLTTWNGGSHNLTIALDTGEFQFGVRSAQITFTPSSGIAYLGQTLPVEGSKEYTASLYLKIPTNLSSSLAIYGYPFDINGDPVLDDLGDPIVLGNTAVNGIATGGWIRTSASFSTPAAAATLEMHFLETENTPTVADVFYVDGVQLQPSANAEVYADGDMSGYCWSGTVGYSTTLQTDFADAFHFFTPPVLNPPTVTGSMGAIGELANIPKPVPPVSLVD